MLRRPFNVLVAKPPSEADKEVVRIFEVPELVACVEVELWGQMGLQGYYLVEALEVFTFIQQVVSDSEMDGEYRHDQFCPC